MNAPDKSGMSNLFEVAEENGVAVLCSSEDRERGSVPGQCKVSRRIAVIGKVHSDAITIRDCTKIVQKWALPPPPISYATVDKG